MSSSTSSGTDGWKVLNPTVAAAKAEVAHSQSDKQSSSAEAASGRLTTHAEVWMGPAMHVCCSECALALRVAALVAARIDGAAAAGTLPLADRRSSRLCSGIIAVSGDAHSPGAGDGPAHGRALRCRRTFGAQDFGAVGPSSPRPPVEAKPRWRP